MWLLAENVLRDLEQARSLGIEPTAEEKQRFSEHRSVSAVEGAPRNLRIAGDVAEIAVEGVLTPKPDFFAFFFGGGNTTYEQIQSALAIADADPSVARAVLKVNSPGGHVDGLFDTIAAIQQFEKPLSVNASCACSAAYALAAAAGEITADNAAVTIGSVGVVASYVLHDDVVDITSTNAPNKRPDPATEEGQAVIREHLDAIHDLMVDAISEGRGVSVSTINADFGRGAVLTAGEAKERGMIDAIAVPQLRAVSPRSAATNATVVPGGAQTKDKTMNLQELRTEHPEVFEQAVKLGATQERDRACAHLTLGKASGDLETAYKAIEDGSELTAKLQAIYMSAGMNRRDVTARQEDSDSAAKALEGAEPEASEEPTKDIGDMVMAELDRLDGVTASA